MQQSPQDQVEAPPTADSGADPDGDGVPNELPTSLIDHEEFYLLNYFKPATYQQTDQTDHGLKKFKEIGCAQCHVPDLQLSRDRRVADVETAYDPANGIFNSLFATAALLFDEADDHTGYPTLKTPKLGPFLVRNIFTDFNHHEEVLAHDVPPALPGGEVYSAVPASSYSTALV